MFEEKVGRRSWAGARWWRFDFHTHTPASEDFGKGPDQAQLRKIHPREWLLAFMRAGVDCVAVTDHNSGAWIDGLKAELEVLANECPDRYRSLVLFPGVELSVNGGVHVLAIMPPDATTSTIDKLLGAVGYHGTRGRSDSATTKSFHDVVKIIDEAGGIPVPAHVDNAKGLLREFEGTTLVQALRCSEVFAMEVVDPNCAKPQSYADQKPGWTEVLGSDSHHLSGEAPARYPGSHYTWVKMGEPSFAGLRLALLDGALSILRSDAPDVNDPNEHADMVLESMTVKQAKYIGRAAPLQIPLNPWLNAVIGGRGTGKSSLVEFLRIALHRETEIPEPLKSEFGKYRKVSKSRGDNGLMTENAELTVMYRKNRRLYRVRRQLGTDATSIQELQDDGAWADAAGDVCQRFPIRIFSQKQVFQLAREPGALLRVVDEAPEVSFQVWRERWQSEERRFLALRAKARELEVGVAEEPRLRGELDDIRRKLAVFEQAGHADVLRTFQSRKRQQRATQAWARTWTSVADRVRDLAADVVPTSLDASLFAEDDAADVELVALGQRTRASLEKLQRSLEDVAVHAERIVCEWSRQLEQSAWGGAFAAATAAHQNLSDQLLLEGVDDPGSYKELVEQCQAAEDRLTELEDRNLQAKAIRQESDESLAKLAKLRGELTAARRGFLEKVLCNNKFVRISVIPYGARTSVEREVRALLGRNDGGFEKDLGDPTGDDGLLGGIYREGGSANIETRILQFKRILRSIAEGDRTENIRDQRFATYLTKLRPESLDRLDVWFPEDTLEVSYSAAGDGSRFVSIQDGSPGQKTAALLAFLLSYGDEPLVLDQPEDDLDNHLIYELIVNQLRQTKHRRQVLVVTHNPNIVVNGDAEYVSALVPKNGQTQIGCAGCLQDQDVRAAICEVMEGGREAFERRYRRIALEGRRLP